MHNGVHHCEETKASVFPLGNRRLFRCIQSGEPGFSGLHLRRRMIGSPSGGIGRRFERPLPAVSRTLADDYLCVCDDEPYYRERPEQDIPQDLFTANNYREYSKSRPDRGLSVTSTVLVPGKNVPLLTNE